MVESFFAVDASKYVEEKKYCIVRPASLKKPKNNAVMFIMESYAEYVPVFMDVKECLIFWPEKMDVPQKVAEENAVVKCSDPHLEYCRFFQENGITYLSKSGEVYQKNGAVIEKEAVIGEDVYIMPGAYIGKEATIGNHVYIGAGTKIVGRVTIGNNVVIRENTVLGADGLSTDRDENGFPVTMPQFGEIIIEDDVQIGANTVIARGAIDETIIKKGSKIDNSCFISHNVEIGENSFVVGETIMFGSSCLKNNVFVSGNSTIRNGVTVGEGAMIGMGSVVVKDIDAGSIVKGNPAK